MLIARAPVRISLAGGGTDIPAYYEAFGGAVLSTTIDKYFYAILNVCEDDKLQISSSDYRTFYLHHSDEPLLWEGDLRLPRAILSHFGIQFGVSMFLASEIPPGTGLGSSSAVAVAIAKAVSTALGFQLDKGELSELACHVEIDILGEPIGKQDQYASAFGGLNWIDFNREGVRVSPLHLDPDVERRLERELLLFFTGSSRTGSQILKDQTDSSQRQDEDVIEALHKVKAMAHAVRDTLRRGDLIGYGELLHENWEQKKRFATGISNPFIDESYDLARRSGAVGGKVTGAGGGGFLLLCCQVETQDSVTRALEERGLKRMDFRFDRMGARVLMNAGLGMTLSKRSHRDGLLSKGYVD
jgi:D-glycero-alpha-D-manno-heptose-7-phosphate kinase